MVCQKCGHNYEESDEVCQNCGLSTQSKIQEAYSSSEPIEQNWFLIFIGALGLVGLFGGLISIFVSDNDDLSLALLLIGCISITIFSIINSKHDKKQDKLLADKKQKMKDELVQKMKSHSITQYFMEKNGMVSIGIDEANHLYWFGGEIFKYKGNEILESQIIEDGTSLTKTSRSSQIGGAMLGGLIAGGTGAIIGGLSGDKKTVNKVQKIVLQIVVNDTKKPIRYVHFLNEANALDKESPQYKGALNKANYWHKMISVLIKQADKEDSKTQTFKEQEDRSKPQTGQGLLVADEIKKLAQLKQEGLLTEQEFDTQKSKLLS